MNESIHSQSSRHSLSIAINLSIQSLSLSTSRYLSPSQSTHRLIHLLITFSFYLGSNMTHNHFHSSLHSLRSLLSLTHTPITLVASFLTLSLSLYISFAFYLLLLLISFTSPLLLFFSILILFLQLLLLLYSFFISTFLHPLTHPL